MGAGIAPSAAHDTLARAIGDPSAALPVGRREQLAVADARGIVRARAELLADERIRDAGGFERRAQALRAELWSKATNGVRTHVGDFGDAVRAQQLEELLERMVRVADRADVGHRARLSSNVVSAPPVRSAARAGRARARRDPARGP